RLTDVQEPTVLLPAVPGSSWLGVWEGTADGVRAGASFDHERITLTIVRDTSVACGGTFAVRITAMFDRCGLTMESEVSASFQYDTDSTRHAIVMERFSGDGQSGNVILGRVRVDRLPSSGALPLIEATITVVRR
ncbi:MAG: hypothetical protein L0271_27770, partial [Gemmatimonadetes bacterium]|nr:hypothetical protein [Gemmatimonadota bacterium]